MNTQKKDNNNEHFRITRQINSSQWVDVLCERQMRHLNMYLELDKKTKSELLKEYAKFLGNPKYQNIDAIIFKSWSKERIIERLVIKLLAESSLAYYELVSKKI
jgi:hypothetical protein